MNNVQLDKLKKRVFNNFIQHTRDRVRKAGCQVRDETGYGYLAFCAALELKFKSGMSWDNYGKEWAIDHVLPLNWFLQLKVVDLKVVNCLANLQPLSKSANEAKGDTFHGDPDKFYRRLLEIEYES